ncbi:YesL family protein [Metabacillus halosaccharovorans]|uniref:YesL family protein n=1 Tax=Metabacillus halosaccharovorans TaxID=930124 RepID=UPI00204260FA|nr:YesL family protein [Metabacillus halosaccharovorans]MCM3443657.1 YesL family protein [Metabacillus halosaccharovorans]
MNSIMGSIYQFCNWCMRLAYVNSLWILFSLAGLIILGLGPSTAAMFAVTRKWIMGEKEIAIFSTFWETYRSEFVKSNILFSVLFVIGYLLFFDLRFLLNFDGLIFTILSVGIASVMIVYLFIALFTFPMFVHYNVKTFQNMKYSFLFVITHPIKLLLLTVSLAPIFLIFFIFPGLLPFFAGSVTSLVVMYFASTIFRKFDSDSLIREEIVN